MADPETGEFWGFFGGFAPLPRKAATDDDKSADSRPPKLLWYNVILVFPSYISVSGCITNVFHSFWLHYQYITNNC